MTAHKPMESHRKSWNKQQSLLRKMLLDAGKHQSAIELFLRQHAALHSAEMSGSGVWSYADAILEDMSESQVRRIPPTGEHSIAWLVWHIARIEDVAMNMLVAGMEQIHTTAGWYDQLRVPFHHTGNMMPAAGVAELSAAIDIPSLREYRLEVGRRTQQIAADLNPEDLKNKVSPVRLQYVLDVGAVLPAAQGLIDYWNRRTIAGLLLMPPTRHNFVHLNEALRLKKATN